MMIDAFYISKVNPRILGLFVVILIAGFGIASAKGVPFGGTGGFIKSTTVIDFESFSIGTQSVVTAGATIHAEFQGFAYPDFTPSDVHVRSQGFVQHAGIFEGQFYGFNAVD
jgi:hypothetical protein